MFEKAWAKIKGNYLISEGGYNQESISALTGIPIFTYLASPTDTTFFSTLLAAD